MSIRRKELIASLSVIVLMAIAGTAWACTSQPRLLAVTPMRSAEKAPVTISGEGVLADKAVTIRWNSLNGPKLAEVTPSPSGSFSTSIIVPEVAPGIYFLLIETAAGVGRTAFEVTADAPGESVSVAPATGQAVRADLWQGFDAGGNGTLSPDAAQSQSSTDPSGGASLATGGLLAAAGLIGIAAFGGIAVRRRKSGTATRS